MTRNRTGRNPKNVARMIELGIADRMSDKPRSFALPPEISEWESKLANLRLRHANAMTVTAAKWATLEGLEANAYSSARHSKILRPRSTSAGKKSRIAGLSSQNGSRGSLLASLKWWTARGL